jgi:hypothetical protein
MTHTILVNGKEFSAYDWAETPLQPGEEANAIQKNDLTDLLPGEVSFRCDQTFVVDTTLEFKGDGRTFMVIASARGLHVAKPY